MAERFSEVLVVGGGAAGAMAALAAAEAGAKARLVVKAFGASHVSSGAIDLVGDPLLVPGKPLEERTDLRANLIETLHRNPRHPLQQLSAEFDGPESRAGHLLRLFEVVAAVLRKRGGLELVGSGSENRARLTPVGTFKFTAFAQAGMGTGFTVEDLSHIRPVFVGIAGLPGAVASRQATVFDDVRVPRPNVHSVSFEIDVPEALGPNANAVGLASLLDEPRFAEKIAEQMAVKLKDFKEADVAIVSPVLGLSKPSECCRLFEATLPCPFAETLAVPPSAPGVRLGMALERMLAGAKVEVIRGEVLPTVEPPRKLRWMSVRDAQGREEKYLFDKLVLAGGRHLGGGLYKDGPVREPLFDLPLFYEGRPVVSGMNDVLFDAHLVRGHVAFGMGVRTDARLRPVDESGKIIFENLFAAGSLLGGCDSVSDGGLGLALLSGYAAGGWAATS